MAANTSFYSIGVCVWDAPSRNVARPMSYSHAIHEILGHAGLCYRKVEQTSLHDVLRELRILVTVGETDPGEVLRNSLKEWVKAGGTWLSISGVCGLHEIFGVRARVWEYTGVAWGGQSATLGEGYLHPEKSTHPLLRDVPLPLHYFNGVAVEPNEGTQFLARVSNSHQHPSTYAGITENRVGDGRCVLIAPDLVGAIVRIRQGTAVTRDGLAAADGSGAVTDGVLKCDDGLALDWTFDRQPVPGAPGLTCFLEPIADHWRDLLLRAIFYLAEQQKVPLAMLWFYPRNLPALAHLSHDSDWNDPDLARRMLEVTKEEDVRATWCIILPGHKPDVIDAIKADGHELAAHYDAMDHPWGEAEFASQLQQLTEQFGERPISNKNHYTRWEGDTDFFEWCERHGIQIDGSKGPSKWGDAGFCFGTSAPYFPIAPDGKVLSVLELPFVTGDLGIFISDDLVEPLVDGVLRTHGVFHLLHHPSHIGREPVEIGLRKAIRAARAEGMEWWTSAQINDWERARRQLTWSDTINSGKYSTTVQSESKLTDATLLFLNVDDAPLTVNGNLSRTENVTRWGFEFVATTTTIEAGQDYKIEFDNQ
jgi:hypothetical protein